MNTQQMSDEFASAFRSRLVSHVETARSRTRRRLFVSAGATAALLAGGTAAAAASGFLPLPGEAIVSEVGVNYSGTFTGTAAIDLDEQPDSATDVALTFSCLTVGTFTFDDGAEVSCTGPADFKSKTTYLLPIDALTGGRVTVTTSDDASWNLTAGYVSAHMSSWLENENGETFGVVNENGLPDLVAVIATNGQQGYVFRSDLEEADGTEAARHFTSPEDALAWQSETAGVTHWLTVFEADGTTPIGRFRIG